jgi:triosephosphate isomerase
MGFARAAADSKVRIGGQDCHAAASGAHTGDIAAEMLADAGATLVIVGHSERRADHGESDSVVRAKATAAIRAGLDCILCVGESATERDAGEAVAVVSVQLGASLPDTMPPERLIVAYEPIWAIGSGRTAAPVDIAVMHKAIRDALIARYGDAGETVRILYGGSVKASNAADILALPNVDGALVGGASLKADEFLAIVAAAPAGESAISPGD